MLQHSSYFTVIEHRISEYQNSACQICERQIIKPRVMRLLTAPMVQRRHASCQLFRFDLLAFLLLFTVCLPASFLPVTIMFFIVTCCHLTCLFKGLTASTVNSYSIVFWPLSMLLVIQLSLPFCIPTACQDILLAVSS